MNIKLLEEYNKLLVRYKMAMIYLDSKDIDMSEKEKFIKPFQELTSRLDKLLKKIKEENIKHTESEILEGFHIEFRLARYTKYNY